MVAIYTLGCLLGSLAIAPVGNFLGRRKSLLLAAAVASVGIILQASSYSLGQLIAGRIICGVGNGGVNAVVPVWQSEVTRPKSRGKSVVVVGVFITSGIALAAWVNVGLSHVDHQEVAWRVPLALPLLFTAMLLAFPMGFPESPRWLLTKDRVEEARAAMMDLNDPDHASSTAIDTEINMILEAMKHDNANQSTRGYIDFFKGGSDRLFYRLFLAVAINFCAQMTGANVISYYGKTIFKESLGMPASEAALLNAGVLTWKIVAATSAFLAVDRIGRKPLFIVACGGMGLSMAGLAASVWAIDNKGSFGASVVAVFFLFLYMAFFPLGFVGANFLYAAEIAPQDLRIHLAAVGSATHWLFNFAIAEITPIAFVTIAWRYYIVYAVIGIMAVPLIYFAFPETKGLSLDDMGRLFSEPKKWWQVPRSARNLRKTFKAADVEGNGKLSDGIAIEVEENPGHSKD